MEASLDARVAELLHAWVAALDELYRAAARTASGDMDGAESIAILHVLEDRAHAAFAAYRAVVLHD